MPGAASSGLRTAFGTILIGVFSGCVVLWMQWLGRGQTLWRTAFGKNAVRGEGAAWLLDPNVLSVLVHLLSS